MIPFKSPLNTWGEIRKGEHLLPEVEEGNREYKFKLTDLSDDQLTHRITQLNWRLNEGNDEAYYLIGVEDNGNQLGLSDEDLQESLQNLQFIADQVGCEMLVQQLYAGEQGTTAEVHMRRRERMTIDVVQVSVAVAGDLDSGKSTMIGVLSTGLLDNGKGLARAQVLTHNHEVESGRTSCISHHMLNFNSSGEVRIFVYFVAGQYQFSFLLLKHFFYCVVSRYSMQLHFPAQVKIADCALSVIWSWRMRRIAASR
jgi:GTPase